MKSDVSGYETRRMRCFIASCLCVALALVVNASLVEAQTFNSGSDGSDLAFIASGPAGTVVVFDPSQFHGTQVSANIFNFTTITIASGVTVRLAGDKISGPVTWLAQGNVDIQGTIDLSGAAGHPGTSNPFLRVPSVPGAGGFAGGVGGTSAQAPLPGNGPGGGAASPNTVQNAAAGTFSGNTFLIPLVGGSGGGGALGSSTSFSAGGGAGGGALMIASTTQISIGSTGVVNAQGGPAGTPATNVNAGSGSGGAIRLISNTIAGSGSLRAGGGICGCGGPNGANGVIRLEAFNISFSGGTSGIVAQSSPFPLLLQTSGTPTAKVIAINGTQISPNPSTFPDLTINTTSPVDVVIQTQNIPSTATVKLTILDQNGVPDTVVSAPPVSNCNSANVCTTTVQVVFPFGASRGLTKVTWVQ